MNGRLPEPLRRGPRLARRGPRSAALLFVAGVWRLAADAGMVRGRAREGERRSAGSESVVAPPAADPGSFSRPPRLSVARSTLGSTRRHRRGPRREEPRHLRGVRLLEKDVTLDVAERLRARVAGAGFTVLMTRAGDDTISLQQRSDIANEGHGDIFVSIHVNALTPKSRGIETYYLGASEAPAADAVAAHENRDSGYSLADLRSLLDRIYLDARKGESKRLAESVQRALCETSGAHHAVEDRGQNGAVVVLVGTEMPAIPGSVLPVERRGGRSWARDIDSRSPTRVRRDSGFPQESPTAARRREMAASKGNEVLRSALISDVAHGHLDSTGERRRRQLVGGRRIWSRERFWNAKCSSAGSLDNRTMVDLRRPLERGLIKEGSRATSAVRELIGRRSAPRTPRENRRPCARCWECRRRP